MLAASCSCAAAKPAAALGCRRPQRQLRRAPRRQPAVCPQAFRESQQHQNGGGAKLAASPDQIHATKMINLCTQYFTEVMSNGNEDACHEILHPQVEHRDMVRNEGRYGISDYQRHIRDLKRTYPEIYVRPTQFAVADDHTLFVAFEGRATAHTPMFKGVDLFFFNDDATKIREVEVYRSNWLGAAGHEERKRAAQQGQQGQQGKPHMAT